MPSLPTPDAVSQTLSTFLRREVFVREVPVNARPPVLGIYKSSSGAPVAVCASDIAFAAFSSAAFALIPVPVARDSVKAGALEEGLGEIFAEVLNVLSRLFASHEGVRVTLMQTVFPPAPLPPSGSQPAPGGELGLEIDIDGYGKGLLVLGLLGAA